MDKTLADRFWRRVKKDEKHPDNCWGWTGSLLERYGKITVNGRGTNAPRASWLLHFGEIPAGMQVCHKCDNPACTNPAHLWLGTAKENCFDKMGKGRSGQSGRPRQNHCARGHEFTENNTYIAQQKKSGKIYEVRYCRECRALWAKRSA